MKGTGNTAPGIIPGVLNLVRPFAMIDLETLGTKSHHPIIEIGICYHKNGVFTARSEYIQPDWSLADENTLKWWHKQDHWEDISRRIEDMGHWSLRRAWQTLMEDFVIQDGIQLNCDMLKYYALGPQFDISMLERQLNGVDLPWYFRNIRDLRTTFDDLNNGNRPKVEVVNDIAHSAASDAERQARQLVHIHQHTTLQTTMNLPGKP